MQNMLKSALKTPAVAKAAPARPKRELVIKPSRRPILAIYREAGKVVVIWAKNKSASGRVASDLLPARAKPITADDARSREVPVMSAAWLNESRTTLRFV